MGIEKEEKEEKEEKWKKCKVDVDGGGGVLRLV